MAFFGKAQEMVETAMVADRPRMASAPHKLTPNVDREVMAEADLAEYRQVAKAVGLAPDDLVVEEFRLFLAKRDIPTFALSEVVSYMDEITAKDNPAKLGWHWCPVRPKDAKVAMTFGRASSQDNRGVLRAASVLTTSIEQSYMNMLANSQLGGGRATSSAVITPGSDFYASGQVTPYARTIPLHALKKIALIEREFGADKAVFLVTDYTVTPHVVINPDPFLMAVIPNGAVAQGKGRFVIDVWDEPGFGIARMVK